MVLAVPDPDAVKVVVLGDEDVSAGSREGSPIIDASTGDPHTARVMYREARQNHIDHIEERISVGKPDNAGTDGAPAGNITFMLVGDEQAVTCALPILRTLGAHAIYLGPSGSGSIVKLLSNRVAGLVNLVLAETFTLGAPLDSDSKPCWRSSRIPILMPT